jgi:hypothetical protein
MNPRVVVASLPTQEQVRLLGFGGSYRTKQGTPSTGHPKLSRPLSRRHWMHLVLATSSSISPQTLALHARWIQTVIRRLGLGVQVQISDVVIQGRSINVTARLPSRKAYLRWVRSVSGLVARRLLSSERGKASTKSCWSARPFTHVLNSSLVLKKIRHWLLMSYAALDNTKTPKSREKHRAQAPPSLSPMGFVG